jgi:hypothetical protein
MRIWFCSSYSLFEETRKGQKHEVLKDAMNHEDNYQVKNPLRVEYIGTDK